MVLVIDNYDSFTYNLVQYIGELGESIEVKRNDAIAVEEVARLEPERIVLSPGPGRPEQAGVSVELVRELGSRIPILGVCLGHQVIASAFGGEIVGAPELLHGKTSTIIHNEQGIFEGLPATFVAGRYHSLIVDGATLPEELEITATAEQDGTIMGIKHRSYSIYGVQFHPESVLTGEGRNLLQNFIGCR
uniref:anthranilate synthase n=1 Tax=uncultured marine thaumarchaeote KM3_68_B04 TaxID=1456242 RepID=A0A075HLQ7_9ARCH|nr:anthranilate synthase component II (trpG) [uncultured marine thaumarchaeote KM3_68_B04]